MKTLAYLAVCGLMLAVAGTAGAVTLTDGNSTATIDIATQAGMNNWTVDGQNYLFQQWFFYRVGATGGEQSIDTLNLTATVLDASTVKLNGQNSQLAVQITYSLVGGSAGSGRADIGETIKLTNLGSTTQTVHFFQYSDFDLSPDLVDAGTFVNANLVRQTGQAVVMQETTVGPPIPTHRELANYNSLLVAFNDTNPTTLADTPIGQTLVGDITWAYQWDFTLARGGIGLISKDKGMLPVPEPLTMLSVFAGISGIGAYIRKRTA